jgi:tRNA isopentenyl-2-thiomethyl-A-37 hydroxylase MiaE
MEKNIKSDNILINRRVSHLLKQKKIKANKNALRLVDRYAKDVVCRLLDVIKHELLIEGRKVMKTKDVRYAIQQLKKSEKERFPEI